MNIRKEKEFEAWFLREYGDGNFSRLESGEYADLAVRNYWGIWQGAWAALGEQSPAVPEGFRIFRSPHEGDTDIHLAMKLGDEGYLMSAWLPEDGSDADNTVGRLAYRLADALLSAQPAQKSRQDAPEPAAESQESPKLRYAPPDVAGLVDWAVRKWHEQVASRPLVNVHRRTLDGVWRQVIRFAGEDDVVLLGPQHDDMLDASGNPVADPCCGDPGDCWEPCGDLGKSEAHERVSDHSPDAAKMVRAFEGGEA